MVATNLINNISFLQTILSTLLYLENYDKLTRGAGLRPAPLPCAYGGTHF